MVWEIIFIWSVPQFGGSSHSLKEAGDRALTTETGGSTSNYGLYSWAWNFP